MMQVTTLTCIMLVCSQEVTAPPRSGSLALAIKGGGFIMAGKGPQTVDAYLSGLEPHAAHMLEEVRAAVHRRMPPNTGFH